MPLYGPPTAAARQPESISGPGLRPTCAPVWLPAGATGRPKHSTGCRVCDGAALDLARRLAPFSTVAFLAAKNPAADRVMGTPERKSEDAAPRGVQSGVSMRSSTSAHGCSLPECRGIELCHWRRHPPIDGPDFAMPRSG